MSSLQCEIHNQTNPDKMTGVWKGDYWRRGRGWGRGGNGVDMITARPLHGDNVTTKPSVLCDEDAPVKIREQNHWDLLLQKWEKV